MPADPRRIGRLARASSPTATRDTVVLQLSSAGAERWRDAIVAALVAATGAACVFERSDAEVRKLEGLPPRIGVAHGALPDAVTFVEDGLAYRVDVVAGQKTGFYLDQRDEPRRRARARRRPRGAQRVLLHGRLHAGGARRRRGARRLDRQLGRRARARAARTSRAIRRLPADRAEWREADAFAELRKLRDRGAAFDLIVLDPPKFAPTAAHAERAARAYKDINLLALKLLRPGGLLATFSCSGGIDAELFRKIVAGAALDAGVDAAVIGRFGAGRRSSGRARVSRKANT